MKKLLFGLILLSNIAYGQYTKLSNPVNFLQNIKTDKSVYLNNDTVYIIGNSDTLRITLKSDTLYFKSTSNYIKFTPTANNLPNSGGAVASVNGQTGVVVITNIAGNSATVTTNANLTGVITSSGNTTSFNTVVPIDKGGTGQATATLGFNALAPSQATNSGKVLTTDGTNSSWVTPAAAVSDGDKGDITVTSSGGVWTIDASTITLAKMANLANGAFIARNAAGTGVPEAVPTATVKTMLGLTGINSGDQTISLTGPVTGTGTGSFATSITNSSVTLPKMADMATSSLIYRKTIGTGVPEVNTLATLKTDLGLTNSNSGDQTITLTGDVTGTGTGSFAATVANDAITYAKMQNVTTNKLLGRATATAGDPEEITLGTGLSYTGTTLNVSAGAGSVTSVSVVTANGVSGTVATATTTPAITLALGAITPTSVAASGTLSGSNFSGTSSGTNTGDQTNISGNAATVTTNANLTGPITSTGNATSITNDAVAFSKLPNLLTSTFIGRSSLGTGDPEEVNISTAKIMLNLANSNSGDMSLTNATPVTYLTNSGQALTVNPIDLSNTVNTSAAALPISRGGTNGVTNTSGFNNLSPLTTNGDILIYNTGNVRLPLGSNGTVLTMTAGFPAWQSAGSATNANNLTGGVAGAVPYQSAPSTTLFTAAGVNNEILQSVGTASPTWTSSPTVSGVNFSLKTVRNQSLVNDSLILGSTTLPLGSTTTTIAGLASVTSTNFVGALTGNVTGNVSGSSGTSTSATNATHLTGGANGSLPYQTSGTTTTFLAPVAIGQVLISGTVPTWSATPTFTGTNISGTASSLTVGTATNAVNTGITEDIATATSVYPTWVTANTGNLPQKTTSTKLSFVPSTGILTAIRFAGNLTGDVTGNVSGSAGTATNVSGIVLGVNGGTGIANTGKTITLGGNLTTSGAFNTTLTSSISANYSLPANSATLASLTLPEVFSTGLKTFNNGVLRIGNNTNTFFYTINGLAISSNRTISLPVLTSDGIIAVNNMQNNFNVAQVIGTSGNTGLVHVASDTLSYAALLAQNSSSKSAALFMNGRSYVTAGSLIASQGGVNSDGVGGVNILATNGLGNILFSTGGFTERMRIDASGHVGINQTSPTSFLHLSAGTAAANSSSLKIPVGTLLSTPEDGAIERDATDLYLDSATIRYVIPHGLKGSATLNFLNIIANSASELTFSLTGAREGDIVILQTPYTTSGIEVRFEAYVTASNVVKVVATNLDALYDVDPPSGVFKVFLIKY